MKIVLIFKMVDNVNVMMDTKKMKLISVKLSTDVLHLDWNVEKIRFVLETKYLDTVVHADLTLLNLKEFALLRAVRPTTKLAI